MSAGSLEKAGAAERQAASVQSELEASPDTEAATDTRINVPHIPFVEHLGIVTEMSANGESRLRYTPQPEHLNSFNVVHGGVCMTLLDVTLAASARCLEPNMGVVTIEMKTSFMQPAQGTLTGKGRLIHRTATMAFTEGTLYNEAGKPCAHATGTFKFVRKLAVGSKKAQELHLPKEMDQVISTD